MKTHQLKKKLVSFYDCCSKIKRLLFKNKINFVITSFGSRNENSEIGVLEANLITPLIYQLTTKLMDMSLCRFQEIPLLK